jgi:Ser/Thr protein kinase RdoA (MazF antagonist)
MREDEALQLCAEHWELSGTADRLATEKDDTFVIDTGAAKYVLKVTNPAEDPQEVDLEVRLMRHVAAAGTVRLPQLFADRNGELLVSIDDAVGQHRQARLMSFIAGTPLDSTESSPGERAAIGRTLGELRLATSTFAHPAQDRIVAWDVQHLLGLRPLLDAVDDPAQREVLEAGLERFERTTAVLPTLRRQVLHNDFNRSNLIVDHTDPQFVRGVLDFADAVHTAIAIDVATALLNQLPRHGLTDDADAFADGRDLLGGYLDVAELTDTEVTTIPFLVMGRVITRALISLYRAALMPGNATYVLRNTQQGWAQLLWFQAHSDDYLADTLHRTEST